jgi:hypothetical protein
MSEDVSTLVSEFNETVKALPIDESRKNEREAFVKDYTKFHSKLGTDDTAYRSRFPADFYDMTPRQQEAIKAWLDAYNLSYGPVCT